MGENGAGKATLMKILFGQQPPDSGTILLNGQEVHFKSVKEAVNAGISMIYQELSPIKELSIAENVFVGQMCIRDRRNTVQQLRFNLLINGVKGIV